MPAMIITAGLAVGIATSGHAETRRLEQVEMNVEPAPLADTSVSAKVHNLPEVVVTGFARTTTTGVVCITYGEVKGGDKPLIAQPVFYENEPVAKEKKKKKRFLFF